MVATYPLEAYGRMPVYCACLCHCEFLAVLLLGQGGVALSRQAAWHIGVEAAQSDAGRKRKVHLEQTAQRSEQCSDGSTW